MKNIITDFGAIGDGVTNDTAAFIAAGISGYPVNIPYTPDGYLVNDSVTICNSHFIGDVGSKIIYQGSNPLFIITTSSTKIQELTIEGSTGNTSTSIPITLQTLNQNLQNIDIQNIYAINTYGFIIDQASTYVLSNINLENINICAPQGNSIYFHNQIAYSTLANVYINYANSVSPNYTAIYINQTAGITGGVTLSDINIVGSNSQSYTSQHGIYIGAGEDAMLSNVNVIYMGGCGITLQGAINFRINNSNVSFCTGNQVVMNFCSDSTISNLMVRGRANGSLSFLILSTYGVVVNSCTRVVFNSCDFKSAGAGVWHTCSSYIGYNGCLMTINYYHGFVSSGTNNIGHINGCVFVGNGIDNILHTSANQYATNCLINSTIQNLNGVGSI